MSEPRVKWVWLRAHATPVPTRWYLGLFGVFVRARRRRHGLMVCLSALLLWSAGLLALGYLTVTTAWYVWLEQRPFNYVTWTDAVLAPVRWDEIRRKRGDAFIAEGMEDFRNQRWGEGSMKIRIGLERQPDARSARRQLAAFFFAARLPDRAIRVLFEGVQTSYPGRDYIKDYLALLWQVENFEQVERVIAAALLHRGDPVDRDRAWLLEQRAQNDLQRGQGAKALAWAQNQDLKDAKTRELEVLAWLQMGQAAEAVKATQDWIAQDSDEPAAYRMQVRAAREAGDLELMDAALEIMRSRAPAQPTAYIYGVVQRAMAGSDRTESSLQDYLFRFGSTAENLAALAQPLSEIGRGDLLRQVFQAAEEQGLSSVPLKKIRVMWLLREEQWREAADVLQLFDPKELVDPDLTAWVSLMRLTVNAALDPAEGARQELLDYFSSRRTSLGAVVYAVERLEAASRWSTSLELLALAQREFGDVDRLQSLRNSIDTAAAEELADQAAARERLASVPVAPVADIEQAELVIRTPVSLAEADESKFFSSVADCLKQGEPRQALSIIGETRRSRPAWLVSRRDDTLRLELQAQFDLRETVAFVSAARLMLNGTNARGLELMSWVDRWDEIGRRDVATSLLGEILRDRPKFPPAERKLASWASPEPSVAP